jgi:transposase-like protein
MSATPRAVPFYCPFCGEQQLRPAEPSAVSDAAAWRCESCDRVFTLAIVRIGVDE